MVLFFLLVPALRGRIAGALLLSRALKRENMRQDQMERTHGKKEKIVRAKKANK